MIREARAILDAREVAVATGIRGYGQSPPYSPSTPWPEYAFGPSELAETSNPAYDGVRSVLMRLGLDESNCDTASWNPLGEIVRPGETVVIKPNFVRDFRESNPDHGDCLVTHGSVIRAVLDYVVIATQGRGRIIIADAPHNDADFDAIAQIVGLFELREFYQRCAGVHIEIYDLRPERAEKIDGVIVGHEALPGDPAGYVRVNLGRDSAFHEVNHLCHLLYGSEYDTRELFRHQNGDTHEYLISKTVLDADVVISLPKLKTHKKVGLTVNMKNLVGINGNKNWLPHHREGTPAQGGDQFQDDALKRRIERWTVATFKRCFPLLGPLRQHMAGPVKSLGKAVFGDTNHDTIRSGNWYGNDTTWRMVLDLNRALMYADSDGHLQRRPARRFFSVVDGIIAGEGNGPLDPTPRDAGMILAGMNPVAVDVACARLSGFDHRRMPMLYRAFEPHSMPLVSFEYEDVVGTSNMAEYDRAMHQVVGPALALRPHFGWKGNVEVREPMGATIS